ncbi:MAG: FAD:protein FMN transferase [Oscillospiraceae bacterium]|nr:FAD:protein FMN transferase [Oscillospiraceae bacterium]
MKTKKATTYQLPLIVLSCLLAATIAALIVIWTVFGTSRSPSEDKYENTTFAMGTYLVQTVYGGADSKSRTEAASAATSAINELEQHISWRQTDSDIQKLNNSAGKASVSLHEDTVSILETALDVAQRTEGAYDPTILPLSLLWNFDAGGTTVPDPSALKEHLQYVDYTQLQLDKQNASAFLKKKHFAVDLGAIGKGAACDAAIDAYRKTDISCGIVASGGSVGVYGKKADGSPWAIGIRNPNSDDTSAAMGTLSIEDGFVSTSGTYERYFQQDGVTYHHILNPKTGYPADTDLVSVTVHCDNGALSDALSTACLVLGTERSQSLLASYNADAIFITKENQVIVSDGLKDCFTITESSFTLQT